MSNCSNCGKNKPLVNKFFKLCLFCNTERLNANKKPKEYDRVKTLKKPLKKPKNKFSEKTKEKIKADEEFYEKCFNMSDHKCEECGCDLPTEFRDDNGKVLARWRYSHIIPKSIASNLRHNIDNINHLCLNDHAKWENGDKESMKIYDKNIKKFPKYF